MFMLFKKKRTADLTRDARAFLQEVFESEPDDFDLSCIRFSKADTEPEDFGQSMSLPRRDRYDTGEIAALMRNASDCSAETLDSLLEASLESTFTDKLIEIIDRKGLRDAEVYHAARMDRRLFSKIRSDRNFKPAKDTALALVFALRLPFPDASDLLSRAGFTLSHSNKRDIILEYFIREGVCDLMDINIVLDNLGQKIIGR